MMDSAGKSSLILANKVQWRCTFINYAQYSAYLMLHRLPIAQGLWGQAKFQQNESAPFICLVSE